MPLSELDFNLGVNITARARTAAAGSWFKKPLYGVDKSPQFRLVKSIANNLAGGADNCMGKIVPVAVGTPVDVDLMNFADIAGQAAQSFARIKVFAAVLLRLEDDAANGNACSGCEIAAATTNGWTGVLKAAGPANGFKCQPGQLFLFATPQALGWVVDATHKVITITNLDGALPARVLLIAGGGST